MKRLPRKLPLSLLLWTAVAAVGLVAPDSSWSRPRAAKPKAVVTRLHFLSCHDGDTCRAKNPEGLQLTVRFLGLDAPEVAPPGRGKKRAPPQPFALEARDELRRRVVGKTLPVEIRGSDPYNRYLALILGKHEDGGPYPQRAPRL
jgi:endonuclease YncB( thermonuclease family)